MSQRIAFAGTPELAAVTLAAMIDAQFGPIAVFTQPDRPAGRGRKLRPSPVKCLAMEHGIPVYQPASFKSDAAASLVEELDLDLMVVAAYGLLLPPRVLAAPRRGCVNVHASALPRWRGAAPIARAIMAGDQTSGATLMQMDAGLDTGPILALAQCPIGSRDTAGQLHDRIAVLGAQTLVANLPGLLAGRLRASAQDHDAHTYAARIEKLEADVDWTLPAAQIDRVIRAFNPWPVAYSCPAGNKTSRVRIWEAEVLPDSHGAPPGTPATGVPGEVLTSAPGRLWIATGDGVLDVVTLQAPGGKPLHVREYTNARPILPGTRFVRSTAAPAQT